jgi:dCMP deaminase
MLTRFSRDELLGNIAQLIAKRSTCLRTQVGAILATEGRIISMGYNGAPSGMSHCTPEKCNEAHPCTETVHAEANTIAFAARKGITTEGSTLYCTHSPCNECAKLIINAGIIRLIYWEQYRDPEPINLLLSARVGVEQY